MSVRLEDVEPADDDAYRRGEPDAGRLILERRWRDATDLRRLLAGCAASWATVFLMFLVSAFDPSWWSLLLALVLLTLTLMASYKLAALAWNTTTITIDAERLAVRHAPISMLGNREILRSDLAGVHHKTIGSDDDDWSGGWSFLVARLHSGKEVRIMAPGGEIDYALVQYAAEQLSAYLERTTGARDPEVCRFAAEQITSYLQHEGNRE